jgi:hypothetical protein
VRRNGEVSQIETARAGMHDLAADYALATNRQTSFADMIVFIIAVFGVYLPS